LDIYTNWRKKPNGNKISHRFPLQDLPKSTKFGFLFLNYTIWQPWRAWQGTSEMKNGRLIGTRKKSSRRERFPNYTHALGLMNMRRNKLLPVRTYKKTHPRFDKRSDDEPTVEPPKKP
jgi:hypothetical protein